MNTRIDGNFHKQLRDYGAGDWNACFHCGNCTAVCQLSENNALFPRRVIRFMQMGMAEKLESSTEPWLCYYCGDCSKTCPRDANPGEMMMVSRRWLTACYDWTGLAKRLYANERLELVLIACIAAVVVILYALALPPMRTTLTAEGGVAINQFAPVELIHYADLVMAAIVAGLLISNIIRMHAKIIGSDRSLSIRPSVYLTEAWRLALHFGTQWRFKKCDAASRTYWHRHWLLMSGYVIMFTMIVVFLPWFQTDTVHPFWHPQRALGYYATFGLLYGLAFMIARRWKKHGEQFRFSHPSDWLFLVMLLLTTVTGILLHYFRIAGMPHATYFMYMAHLAILVPMILVEVPFSKWSHLAYRPFAVYFSRLRELSAAEPHVI